MSSSSFRSSVVTTVRILSSLWVPSSFFSASAAVITSGGSSPSSRSILFVVVSSFSSTSRTSAPSCPQDVTIFWITCSAVSLESTSAAFFPSTMIYHGAFIRVPSDSRTGASHPSAAAAFAEVIPQVAADSRITTIISSFLLGTGSAFFSEIVLFICTSRFYPSREWNTKISIPIF